MSKPRGRPGRVLKRLGTCGPDKWAVVKYAQDVYALERLFREGFIEVAARLTPAGRQHIADVKLFEEAVR